MPVLTPSTAPPSSLPTKSNGVVPQQNPRSAIPLQAEEDSPKPRIPTVRLDVPIVTDSIAARLATTLLNHVLFLKSQVPLPVMILHKQRQACVYIRSILLQKSSRVYSVDEHKGRQTPTRTAEHSRYPLITPRYDVYGAFNC
ncbi:hypothetical protein PQX77_003546, partial [Marasmius sp. AFHP31]